MMTDNPMPPLTKLMRQLREQMKEVGMTLHHFSVAPNLDPSGIHHAQAVVTLGEEPPPKQEDDPEFDALIEGQKKAEDDARAAQARKELEELQAELADPSKGLGLDPDS